MQTQDVAATTEGALRKGFLSPPDEAKLRCYWWWLNGNTTADTIDDDLAEMKAKGFGGVLLVDANGSNQNGNADVPAGPTFGSPEWTRLYVHALKVAAGLHLQVTLNITSGWNLGGPGVKPEEGAKILTWSRQLVEGGGFDGILPQPPIKNGFYREIATLAYPLAHGSSLPGAEGDARAAIRDLRLKSAAAETGFSMPPSEPLLEDVPATAGEEDTTVAGVVDLSAQVSATGRLRWTPPHPGAWEILRVGYTDSDARVSTSSGKWQGLAIDYLDPGAFDRYWDSVVAPLLDVSKPYLHTTLVNLATDSWELGGTNWTGRFAAEFRRTRGYDPVPYLPVVAGRIVGDRAASNQFLADLRRTVGDLVTGHYDRFAERAQVYGLGMESESGGPHGAPLDALETFRSSAAPQTEYWAESKEHRSTDAERFFTKEAASAADIYGKRFAAQEGMTSIGPQWSESLASDLKPSFDRALTEGMNRLIWHEFTSSPAEFGLPGNEYFAGTHVNPRVTWWNQSEPFFRYLNRSQFLMQQGHAVDDVLYFYGNQVPNFVRLKSDDPARVLPGYDYDVTDEDALLHSLRFDGGTISTPGGNVYRVLALPRSRRLRLAVLERIASYVDDGGSVAGLPPLGPAEVLDGPAAKRFSAISRALWARCGDAPHRYGRGLVSCSADTRSLLAAMKIPPDFASDSKLLDYVHRADGGRDIYFIRNSGSAPLDTYVSLRVAGGAPELWDAIDGAVTLARDFTVEGAVTRMPLHLAAFGSVFVVFGRAAGAHGTRAIEDRRAVPAVPVVHELPAAQWTIAFQPGRGAAVGEQPLRAFESWSESTTPGIRYFSGTAIYRTWIDVQPRTSSILTLSELHEIATVRVNGREVGTMWAMPYRLDITAALHPGRNAIEIEVTDLWPNRIIGDANAGGGPTYTRTNIRKYTADTPLLPSGIVGPVRVETTPLP